MDWLADQSEVQDAAQVAYLFKLDPVDILRSPWWERQIRVAAARHVGELTSGKVTPDAFDPTM